MSLDVINRISLDDLYVLYEWKYSTYFSLHYSADISTNYFFDGYKLFDNLEYGLGTNPKDVRIDSFKVGTRISDIIDMLRKINKIYYGEPEEIYTEKHINQTYLQDMFEGYRISEGVDVMLKAVINKIEIGFLSNRVGISKSYYGTNKLYRKIVPSENPTNTGYEDSMGIKVYSEYTCDILKYLNGVDSNMTVEDYINFDKYGEWGWVFETLDRTEENASLIDDVTYRQTINKIAGETFTSDFYKLYEVDKNKDYSSFLLQDLSYSTIHVIKTQWGRIAITLKNYTDYENDDICHALNNTLFTVLNHMDLKNQGIIEITKRGIMISLQREGKLNNNYLDDINVPFLFCNCLSAEYFGNLVKLIYRDVVIYVEASVIPHLYYHLNVKDWYVEVDMSNAEDSLLEQLSEYLYTGIE